MLCNGPSVVALLRLTQKTPLLGEPHPGLRRRAVGRGFSVISQQSVLSEVSANRHARGTSLHTNQLRRHCEKKRREPCRCVLECCLCPPGQSLGDSAGHHHHRQRESAVTAVCTWPPGDGRGPQICDEWLHDVLCSQTWLHIKSSVNLKKKQKAHKHTCWYKPASHEEILFQSDW